MIALFLLQLVVANPVTFAWDANPASENVTGYRLVVDQTISDVGSATTMMQTLPAGAHQAAVLAYNAAGVSALSSPPLLFSIGQPPDPCLPPLGAHAPAIFLTSITITNGKPGSRSFLSYQLGGPDRVVETAVQINGIDQLPVGRATGPTDDVKPYGSMWFTQPPVGTYAIGLRVKTSFGCELIRGGKTLVVK